mmetsp:Transcript_17019/g.36674  ORF Transcript_17019/g.36674 Transcript_17019/m.36674 type:complete len:471 (+) Transcript_17019:430-1842(+)
MPSLSARVPDPLGAERKALPPRATLIRNVVILACAVDAADKQLLPATFKAMDDELHIGASGLATLTFVQTIGFSLALPVWGSFMRYRTAMDLMYNGCCLWGLATLMLAVTSSWHAQIVLRFIVGFALASVNPLGQAIICDVVEEHARGDAFGLLQAFSAGLSMLVSFGATAFASKTALGVAGWRHAYILIAFFSLGTAWCLKSLPDTGSVPAGAQTSWLQEQKRVLKAVGGKPSFYIMVAQGVTGGVPWNAFAFLTFFFQLSGYTDMQAGQIMLLGGIASVCGAMLGGRLGDFASAPQRLPLAGRCLVAQTSVCLGMIFFACTISTPFSTTSFRTVCMFYMLFSVSACWTQASALRPMCGELFTNAQDRAQILALWIALEGIISAFCGAPLASFLAQSFGYGLNNGGSAIPSDPIERANDVQALQKALMGVSMLPWALCAAAWFPMYFTYPRDKQAGRAQGLASLEGKGV